MTHAVPVRLNGFRGGVGKIKVTYAKRSGRHHLVEVVPISVARDHQTFRVPVTSAAHRVLSRCTSVRISATVRLREGGRLITRTAHGSVVLHPPSCRRFFPPEAVWNIPLPRQMPIDPASRQLVNTVAADAARLGATINTSRYSTPVYTVAADQTRVPYTIDSSVSTVSRVRSEFAGGVPIPADARPSAGNDGQLTVWQPATNKMWELYKAHKVAGRWRGGWGAVMTHVSTNLGYYPRLPGGIWISTTATGLPLVGGLITLADLRRGRIDHALQIGLPDTRAYTESFPALLNDGFAKGPATVPEGARFRLPAGLDIGALHLPPLTRMLAHAAQKYGIIVDDTSGAVTFRGQDALGGAEWQKAVGNLTMLQTVGRFPFKRLQLLRMLLHGLSAPRPYRLANGRTTQASPQQRVPPQCYVYGIASFVDTCRG